MEISGELLTLVTTAATGIFGIFIKMQKDYNDRLKSNYDEKVLMLSQHLSRLEAKQNQYEEKINILNNKIFLLQEEYEINVPVIFHKENGEIIFNNKNAVGISLNNPDLLNFFSRIKRLKRATLETTLNNEHYLVATCMKEYPLNDILITFLFTK